MWHGEESIVTKAPPEKIWVLLSDVPGWTAWNAGIETIDLHGPFQQGSTFTMKPPGEDALESTLVDVDPERGFTDETIVGDVRVIVRHRFESIGDGEVRITYSTDVTGPDAAAVGAMVTADFPEVLAALKTLAETQ